MRQAEGLHGRGRPARSLDAAIDRLVWYAGWADKITQVVGNANPVAGPFFNLSTPEPTGVVAVLAPAGVQPARPGQRGRAGDRHRQHRRRGRVVHDRPLPAVTFAEVLATSDVPGRRGQHPDRLAATAPRRTLASHMDVNAIDLTGLAGDAEQATALEVAAAENLKRVRRAPAAEPDWTADPGTRPR